jgi:hypothetical protein
MLAFVRLVTHINDEAVQFAVGQRCHRSYRIQDRHRVGDIKSKRLNIITAIQMYILEGQYPECSLGVQLPRRRNDLVPLSLEREGYRRD